MEAAPQPSQSPSPRSATAEAFLDAAERLLVEVGHAGITTRRLAAEAGANQALSWSRPELRPRVARVNAEWRAVLRSAYERAAQEYGLGDEFPVEALVAMTMTFGQGFALERLEGIDEGHGELLDWIERWLVSLEERRKTL